MRASKKAALAFSKELSKFLQWHLDSGKLSPADMRELLGFYIQEIEIMEHLAEVEDNAVAKSLRIAGRLT